MNILETIKSSKNVFLKNTADDIQKFKVLKHNSVDLQLFLLNSIAKIQIAGRQFICTANKTLVEKITNSKNITKFNKNVLNIFIIKKLVIFFDLSTKKYITLNCKNDWEILDFVIIKPENIELLSKMLLQI